MKTIIFLLILELFLNAGESYYKKGVLVELQNVQKSRALNDTDLDYYTTQTGKSVGVKDEILLKCKDGVTCLTFLKNYSYASVKNITPSIYILKIKDGDSVFSLSRELYESGKVEFAHPNFTKRKELR